MTAAPKADPLASLTKAEVFALRLRREGGLKTPEIAFAMGWTEGEALAALGKVRHLEARACLR